LQGGILSLAAPKKLPCFAYTELTLNRKKGGEQ